ncbi:hypothetical protein AAFF_G00016370 [Aldrovandia affinis]|uniref:Uncharacterized protein n=1 Tax=Aldrovandia affinis TaxID=143900 RepID=A0AAD7S5X6_9TELE|nr:hypothetical protein AAFF_G00016370 [Aldrovandia affinis]
MKYSLLVDQEKGNQRHQRSLRQKTVSFTLARVVRRSITISRSRTHEAILEQLDVASALALVHGGEEEVEGDSRVEQEVEGDSRVEEEVEGDSRVEEEEVVLDDPERVPEEGPSVPLSPSAQADSTTTSLTITSRAVGLYYGLAKRCWSEIQLRSVSLPLSLSPASAHTPAARAPALTLPLPLLSTLVPAPSPLPPSLPLPVRPSSAPSATPAPPADEPPPVERAPRPLSPAQAPGPKPSRLAGLYLLLSFFFPSFYFFPICLPPACRRLPG